MVVGRSGSMKSMWAMWYAWVTGVNCLYFSADQAPFHSITRLGSLLSGDSVSNVAAAVDAGPVAMGYYEEAFTHSKMDFVFESSPTLDDMANQISSYVELRDSYPDLIVIDTLNNVDAQREDKYGGLALIEVELHRMARETGAAILIVHHTKESTSKPYPQDKASIDGKIDKLFERILTVAYNPNSGEFMMAPVKNRDGKCDASGEKYVTLHALPEFARFETPRFGGWQ